MRPTQACGRHLYRVVRLVWCGVQVPHLSRPENEPLCAVIQTRYCFTHPYAIRLALGWRKEVDPSALGDMGGSSGRAGLRWPLRARCLIFAAANQTDLSKTYRFTHTCYLEEMRHGGRPNKWPYVRPGPITKYDRRGPRRWGVGPRRRGPRPASVDSR